MDSFEIGSILYIQKIRLFREPLLKRVPRRSYFSGASLSVGRQIVDEADKRFVLLRVMRCRYTADAHQGQKAAGR